MDNITVKSEFIDDEMEESYAEDVQRAIAEREYELSNEYEIGNQSAIIHHSAAGSELDMEEENYTPCDVNSANSAQPNVVVENKKPSKTSKIRDGSNVRFEFTTGFRRNSSLIYLIDEKQLFTKKYTHNNLDRYTCYNKSCKASLLFDGRLNKIIKLYHTFHSHPDQSDVYKKMRVINEMKEYCLTNDGFNLTTKQIFDRKCDVMKEAAHLVEYNRIKRNLNRLKKTATQTPLIGSNCEEMMNENATGEKNDSTSTWLPRPSNQTAPARVPSPTFSDGNSVSNIEQHATSTPNPSSSHLKTSPPAFKKIKISQSVPYTEGYLEDDVTYPSKTSNIRKSPPRTNKRVFPEEGNHICTSCPCIAAQENEYDKIGKAWASELKLMTKEQQIFAKRAIAEIIFEGQLGGLSRNSVTIRRENQHNDDDPFVIENPEYIFEKAE